MVDRERIRKRGWASPSAQSSDALPFEKRPKTASNIEPAFPSRLAEEASSLPVLEGLSSGQNQNPGKFGLAAPKQPHTYRPVQVYDWKVILCNFLNVEPTTSDEELFNEMKEAFDVLGEAETLKQEAMHSKGPPRGEIVYEVFCRSERSLTLYASKPAVVTGNPGTSLNDHLKGNEVISNLELHLERHKDISFVVRRKLNCCGPRSQRKTLTSRHKAPSSPTGSDLSTFFQEEVIHIISEALLESLQYISQDALDDMEHPKFKRYLEESDDESVEVDIVHPYLWWFHRRQEIEDASSRLGVRLKTAFNPLQEYICCRMGSEWSAVDSYRGSGNIIAEYIHYLFVPNSILISKDEGVLPHQLRGVFSTSWLRVEQPSSNMYHASIDARSWKFHGRFSQHSQEQVIDDLPEASDDGSFGINQLVLYPMDFATEETVSILQKRGEMFWKCRRQHYVSSTLVLNDGIQPSFDSRYMVDFGVYRKMHPEQRDSTRKDDTQYDMTMEEELLLTDLGDEFFICLPSRVFGFDMQKKEWVKLEVAFIEDVKWNEEAFKQLVIEENTKELVEAVVTHQLQAEENTDLIRGKGNGLFILLHGGPGTGKTLTAESVAEIAKKPLYRVTCGDVGTRAEDVEKYLNTVMLLGKTWNCVVLLDEADVFLEQRTIQNLERNALVSVFLRVLEYYDSIMILTSNRVGIFDEAFKSRIQLTLRYKNLDEVQREQIWENFITRDFGIDAEGIRKHLKKLAGANLNGREIRNAVSTARQLAIHRKEHMGYSHILRVIEEVDRFDEYLKELGRGFSQDDISRGKGER
ncbi:ATPase [Colletotrichum cereale]|nr:ATPase [Colletotrichum cereale]